MGDVSAVVANYFSKAGINKQNVLSSNIKIAYQNPVIEWFWVDATGTRILDATGNPQPIPTGTKVIVPSTTGASASILNQTDDALNRTAPLYDQPGLGGATINQNSLAIPYNLPNGSTATTQDTPAISTEYHRFKIVNVEAEKFVRIKYTAKVAMKISFRTWAVCYNQNAKDYVPLSETNWSLNVDSNDSSTVGVVTGDFQPSTSQPVNGPPFANDAQMGEFVDDAQTITITK